VSLSAVARISTAALQNNLDRVRQSAPGCRVMAVIKANAYGHGLEGVAGILKSADAFAVARIQEGVRLRRVDAAKPIVVLSDWADQEDVGLALDNELQLVVHNEAQIDLLELPIPNESSGHERLTIWLKVDSGMGRLGIAPTDARNAIDRIRASSSVASCLRLMTHLACADEAGNSATADQLQCFSDAIGAWDGDVSIANSAGILSWPETLAPGPTLQYSGDNWVRPGLMLYGISPFPAKTSADLGLQPVMSFEARLIAVRRLRKGARVGYGGDWQAPRDSIVGVVDVGYGDGYPWRLPSGTPVLVEDVVAPLIGRVSMDLISVDLTDVAGARVGDRVVLWGSEPDVASLADRAGTISYELLSGVGGRVRREIV